MKNHSFHPESIKTLPDLLQARAAREGGATFLRYLEEDAEEVLSFSDLHATALRFGSGLPDLPSGSRILVATSNPREFAQAFFGIIYRGHIPIPVPAPRLGDSISAWDRLLDRSGACAAYVDEAMADRWRDSSRMQGCRIEILSERRILAEAHAGFQTCSPSPDDVAFLQFTSGSTSSPKGVIVTHGNILANEALIKESFGHTSSTIFGSWLPLYHDMGLIGGLLQPLFLGVEAVFLTPMSFLQKPGRLLAAISRHGVTTCGMPDFGYLHCIQKVKASELEALDLSTWRVAFNGAEPVRRSTMDAFAEKFSPVGFRREAFFPCYGLAEATLFVTGGFLDTSRTDTGTESGEREPANPVSCGKVSPVQELWVVEAETGEQCAEGRVGELWVRGPCVAAGYWGDPDETAATFAAFTSTGEGPFLRTGDLGYVQDGELHITGRLKDLIIIRGKNHYPQDLEASAVSAKDAFVPGGAASFVVTDGVDDGVVLVQEVRREAIRRADIREWAGLVKDIVFQRHGVKVDDVVFVYPASIPRTTSGKIRRRRCREMHLAGELRTLEDMTESQ